MRLINGLRLRSICDLSSMARIIVSLNKDLGTSKRTKFEPRTIKRPLWAFFFYIVAGLVTIALCIAQCSNQGYTKKTPFRTFSYLVAGLGLWHCANAQRSNQIKNAQVWAFSFFSSGAWIRTKDLRVMSPTSYRCSTPQQGTQ